MKKLTEKKDSDNKRKFEKEMNVSVTILAIILFIIMIFTYGRISVLYMSFYALPSAFLLLYLFWNRKGKSEKLLTVCGGPVIFSFLPSSFERNRQYNGD